MTRYSQYRASDFMQRQLSQFENWTHLWHMRVNPTKSVCMTFTLNRGECPPFVLNGDLIPMVNSVNYFRIHLDKRLTWRQKTSNK